MYFHPQNNAPYLATPRQINELLRQKDTDGWDKIHSDCRAVIVQNVVLHFGGSKEEYEVAAKELLKFHNEARPAYFCHLQARLNWANLDRSSKIGRIKEKLEKNAQFSDAQCGFSKYRDRMIDFLLYSRIYEWGDPDKVKTPRERLRYFNKLLESVGFQPLYLFRSDDFLVQLAVLLKWSYQEYLERLASPLKATMDEARSSEADKSNIFTGSAEAFMYRITGVGDATDAPCGKDDKDITAWSFVNKFKDEFGRNRVSAYYGLYLLMGHRGGIVENLEAHTRLNTAYIAEKVMTNEEAPYLMGGSKRNILHNLAKRALALNKIYCRQLYEDACKTYHETFPNKPLPGPVQLASLFDDDSFRQEILKRWLCCVFHKNIWNDRLETNDIFNIYKHKFEEKSRKLDPQTEAKINNDFLSYIDDIRSSKLSPTAADEEDAQREYDPHHDVLPEGHTIDRKVFQHEKDVSNEDILSLLTFNLTADQLIAFLPSQSPFGYDQVETANAVVRKMDELLNALDMPSLHADSSRLAFLLLSALYNGVDYNQLVEDQGKKNFYPLKDYVFNQILSPAESEA